MPRAARTVAQAENSEEKETSTTEEVKNAEVVEEKQADAVAKEPAISTTEKI